MGVIMVISMVPQGWLLLCGFFYGVGCHWNLISFFYSWKTNTKIWERETEILNSGTSSFVAVLEIWKQFFWTMKKKNCSQKQKIEGNKLVTKPSLRFLRWGKVTYKRFFLKFFWENYKRRLKEQLDSKNYKTLSWQKMKVWLLGLEHSIGTRFWKNVLSVCWGDFSQIGLLTNVMQRLYCNLCGKWVWCSYCWYWRWYLPI